MSEDEVEYKAEKSKQQIPSFTSKNRKCNSECGTDNLKRNENDSFGKWEKLPFDKQIELIFTFALVMFTAVLAFAAIYQFGIMRDQMQNSTRPWLNAAGVSAQNGFKVGESPTVIIKFKNSGNSPARDVMLKYNMTLLVAPIPDNMPMGQYLSKEPSRGVVAPNSEFSSPKYTKKEIIFTEDSISKISNNDLRLYVFGFIDYLDIFNQRHCTYFCFASYVMGTENNLSFQMCSNNNEMIDEECKYK